MTPDVISQEQSAGIQTTESTNKPCVDLAGNHQIEWDSVHIGAALTHATSTRTRFHFEMENENSLRSDERLGPVSEEIIAVRTNTPGMQKI